MIDVLTREKIRELKDINPFELMEVALTHLAEYLHSPDGVDVRVIKNGLEAEVYDVDQHPGANKPVSSRSAAFLLIFNREWQDTKAFAGWQQAKKDLYDKLLADCQTPPPIQTHDNDHLPDNT